MAAHQAPPSLARTLDSPGKNTGVGCHFLLQCMKVKSESEVAQVVPDPQRPHGLQPTRLLHPRDFPGRSTGVGCHCLLRLATLGAAKAGSLLKCRVWGYVPDLLNQNLHFCKILRGLVPHLKKTSLKNFYEADFRERHYTVTSIGCLFNQWLVCLFLLLH